MIGLKWADIDASDYAQEGSFTIEGTVEGTSIKAICTVEVSKSNTVSTVEEVSASVPYEGTVSLPQQVTVTMANGAQEVRNVTWGDLSGASSVLGQHVLTGTVEGTDRPAVCRLYVYSEINLVSAIASSTAETTVGVAPVLPETASVTYVDGTQGTLPIVWDTIPEDAYQQEGSFTVYGYAAGFGAQAQCTVTVGESTDPDQEYGFTVNFTTNAEISVNGEDNAIANLIGKYTSSLKAGDAYTLVFTPRVDGREFSAVLANGEDCSDQIVYDEETNTTTFTYEGSMAAAAQTLEFTFTVVDKQILRNVIATAEGLAGGDEYNAAIPTVQKIFDNALQAAKDVEADHAATQDAINGAWSDLLDAIHLLGFAEGDTTELEELLAIAGMLDEAGYTPSSWSVLQKAMDAAQEVLADEEPLQADVEEAYDALYDALTNLDLVADTSKLQAVVNQAESIDLADYLEDGQDAFLEALDAAKDVLENLDATQAEVDEAAETLNRAMAALRKIPSREELQKLIDETEQIDLDEYTDRSAASLQAALRVAKAVVADANASKEELASAYNAVQTARDGLVKAENQQPQKGSSGSTSANASNAYGAAGVSVVTAAQNVATPASVRSDTTVDFTLLHGQAYCFKMTVVNGNGMAPSFTVGNGSVLKTQFLTQIGNDYYYRVWATGTPGQSTGVYTTLPGQNAVKHCTVTIG